MGVGDDEVEDSVLDSRVEKKMSWAERTLEAGVACSGTWGGIHLVCEET